MKVRLKCGRHVRRSDKQRIADHFHVHGPSLPDFGPSWNVAPQTLQPIVRLGIWIGPPTFDLIEKTWTRPVHFTLG